MISTQDLMASPAWLPIQPLADDHGQGSSPGSMQLVRLDEGAYRAASFLDQRMLKSGCQQAHCAVADLADAAARLPARAHYIFHIGHVGSTLISRLLGEWRGLFSVREPALLRMAARRPRGTPRCPGLRDTLGLLSRVWRTDQRAVIKATSFVCEAASAILGLDAEARAVFLFTPALAYLRCILGGPNSRVEYRAMAPSRLERLRRRLGPAVPLEPGSEGEWIAMSWLCEMSALRQAAAQSGSRVVWMDFDEFLAAPDARLAAVLQHLGQQPDLKELEAVLSGPLMRQYSKAPEHAYDAALRRSVLATADLEHAAEIRSGLRWLASLGGRHPVVDSLLGIDGSRH